MNSATKTKPLPSKILSVILAIALVLPSICFFSLTADAASVKAASVAPGDVTFVAPEQIYLCPNTLASVGSYQDTFSIYVNNTNAGATTANRSDTTGYIYWAYAKASSATLSYRFVNSSFTALSGGSATLSTTACGTSKTVNITAGTAPSLKGGEGCWIEWIMTYVDSTDSLTKKAYAYTYVYNPYTLPIAAGGDAGTGTSSGANWAGQITWISGFHSLISSTYTLDSDWDDRYSNYYTNLSNFSAFISSVNKGMTGTTSVTTGAQKHSSVGDYKYTTSGYSTDYVVFANCTGSYKFKNDWDNNNPSGIGSSSSGTYTSNIPNYWCGKYRANTKNVQACVKAGSYGNIYIDTSRYSNLSQIPNLSIGMIVTDDEASESKSGTWYVGDYSENTKSGSGYTTWHKDSDNRSTYYNDVNYKIAGQGTSATNTSYYESEGIRYAGAWPRTLLGSTTTQGATQRYWAKGFYGNEDDGYYASTHCIVSIQATYYNKANLRTAVNNATKAMAKMGVSGSSSGSLTSSYFDANTSYAWTALQTAYKNAVLNLTNLQSTSNPDTLATSLNSAMDGLKTAIKFNANGGTLSSTTTVYVDVGTTTGVNTSVSYTPTYTGTRTGYTLGGWATTSTGTAAKSVTVGYNNTLYAIWTANTYYVKFNANGGSGTMSNQTFKYDTAQALTANAFTRTGYTFLGWSTSSSATSATYTNSQSVSNLTSTSGGTVNLYAVWSINQYYLDLNGNLDGTSGGNITNYGTADVYVNGSLVSNDCTDFYTKYNYGSTYEIKDIKATTGHTYLGVYSGSVSGSIPASNVAVVLKFKTNSSTLTVNPNGGTWNSSTASQSFTQNYNTTKAIPVPTRTGYTFTGWTRTNTYGSITSTTAAATYTFGATDAVTDTLTAGWKANTYTVAYNANGGTGTTASSSHTYDTAKALTANGFSKTGYYFAGWATSATATTATYTDKQSVTNLTATNGATVTLYAVWTKNPYTIAFNANGGTGTTASVSATYDTAATLTANGFTRTGYTFLGWAETATGAKKYDDKASVTNLTTVKGGTVTLYAVWNANTYTVNYDANGGTGTTESSSHTYDEAKVLTANGFTRTGYTFLGWSTSSAATTATYTDKQSVSNLTATDNGTVTLYAVWSENSYTVNFDANGGTGTTAPQTLAYTASAALNANAFTKEGYTFTGWAETADGAVKYADKATVSKLVETKDGSITLYAVWQANTYSVVFNANGGTGSMSEQFITFDTSAALTANTYTRTGYTFKGWAETATGTVKYTDGQTVKNLASGEGDKVNVYAVWEANTFTVNYAKGEGTGTEFADTVTYDSDYKIAANVFTKEGYHFTGWLGSDGNTYMPGSAGSTIVAENNGTITLTAQFEINTYTIKFVDGNGNVLDTQTVNHGTVPAYDAATKGTPTKTMTASTVYTWNGGWTESVVAATQDKTYTADFDETVRQYSITFDPNNGVDAATTIQVDWDTLPIAPITPAKAATAKYTYTFTGWDKEIAKVSGDATYTAQYSSTINKYTVTFVNYDGTVLQSSAVEYDALPAYTAATPVKPAATGYTTTFTGWDKTIATVTGDVTYTAQFVTTANKYTVKFSAPDATSGEMADIAMTYDEAKTLTANAFARTGYTFAGWDNNGTTIADGAEIKNLASADGAVVTLTAKWTANKYTVTYDKGTATTGAAIVDTETYDTAFTVKAADTYTYIGYTFAGWKCSNGETYAAGTELSNLSAVNGAAFTMTALWTANKYTVTFTKGIALEGDDITINCTYDEAFNLLARTTYAREGYGFTGWLSSADSVVYDADSEVKNLTAENGASITFTAQFSVSHYKLAFDKNVDAETVVTGTMVDEIFAYDVAQNISLNAFTRTGYTFEGWNTAADGTGTAYADGQEVEKLTSTDMNTITLYAQWKPIHYSVQFSVNYGDGTVVDNIMDCVYDQVYTITEVQPTRTGYQFLGWATTPDATKPEYSRIADAFKRNLATPVIAEDDHISFVNLTDMADKNVQLYAVWQANTYTVTFHAGAGEGTMAAQTLTYDQLTALNANTFTKTGYSFDYWTDDMGTEYADCHEVANLTAEQNGNVDLYANWKANTYTVKFNGTTYDGGETMTDQVFTYDTAAKLESNAFTKTGYIFTGWAATESGAVAYIDGAEVKNLTPEVNGVVTLYAVWTPITYNVAFDSDNGTGTMSVMTLTYDKAATLTANAFTKTGYTYTGWLGSDGITYADGATVNNLTAVNGATVTMTAQWAVHSYDVAFNGNGSTAGAMANEAFTYDAPKALTANAYSKTGYTFNGWNSVADGSGDAYADTQNVINLTAEDNGVYNVYAQWLANNYTAVFGAGTGKGADTVVAATYDTPFTVIGSDSYSKIGYTFAGWYSTADEKVYTPGDTAINLTTDVDGSVDFTALWTANNYTVIMVAGKGTGADVTIPAVYDETVTLPENTFTRTGYYFAGWQAADGTVYPAGAELKNLTADVDGKVTFTAFWLPYYFTITFVDGDGNTIQNTKFAYDSMPEYTGATPTKSWTPQYTYTWNGGWTPEINTVTGEATYTATFDARINEYTVKYYNYDGTLLDTQVVKYGEKAIYGALTPMKTNTDDVRYDFCGWDADLDAVTEDISVTAQFAVHNYTFIEKLANFFHKIINTFRALLGGNSGSNYTIGSGSNIGGGECE